MWELYGQYQARIKEEYGEVEEQWLLGGVESLQFSCFDGAQWFDEWDTTSTGSSLSSSATARWSRARARL